LYTHKHRNFNFFMAVPFSVIAKKLKMEGPRLRRELRRLKIEGLDPKADFFKKEIALRIIGFLMGSLKKPPFKIKAKEDKEEKSKDVIYLPSSISVKNLAGVLKIPVTDLLKKILKEGLTVNLNQSLDFETASLIAADFGKEVELKEEIEEREETGEGRGEMRAPIVVIMGHVDHGKTTLLDYIRKTKLAQKEAGGITQHIGAYQVEVISDGEKKKITFIDTPGHEAFSHLRSLGAKVTDLAIIVVAADDGVKPQTIEAIDHCKAAGVPIIVAINKIDKKGANPENVKKQLAEIGLLPEEWGGTVPTCEISAKYGKNIDELLELIVLTAEIYDIRGERQGNGEGVVIESHLEQGRGPLATIICLNGIFKESDIIVAGKSWGRIKKIEDENLRPKEKLFPGEPARIFGFKSLPIPGTKIRVVKNKKEAYDLMEEWEKEFRANAPRPISSIKSEKTLPIIIKADTQGSLNSLKTSLEKMIEEDIKIKIIHSGVGNICESDIYLASVSNSIVFGFRVKEDMPAKKLAEQRNVKVEIFEVIYDLLEEARKMLKGVGLEEEEKAEGAADVLRIFSKKIVGAELIKGEVFVGAKFKIMRGGKEIGEGEVASLRIFKEEVEKIDKPATQFGLGIKTKTTLKEGDKLEFFK